MLLLVERSPELTPAGAAARVKTLVERHVLTAEALDRQAGKLEGTEVAYRVRPGHRDAV